jgi:CheY-like chemotaxis protein
VIRLDLLVQAVEPMLRSLVPEHVTLELRLAPGCWNVWVDRGQLEQVLVNLTMNAVHAMPGGGTLTIETSNVVLTEDQVRDLEGLEPGGHVRLVVRDTGAGIEPEVLAYVFEPFFTTKDIGEGTGLGLASSYGIAKQWGGHIAIASEVAHGTAVTLLFPRSRKESLPRDEGVPAEKPPEGIGARILLVEDQPEVRYTARRLLESAGHKVTEACDGEEALAHLELRGLEVDLVLSDVVMPRMNGKALADHLARTRPALPVILMTGYSRGMLSESGLLDPAYRVIEKPFERAMLLSEVDDMVRTSSAGSARPRVQGT